MSVPGPGAKPSPPRLRSLSLLAADLPRNRWKTALVGLALGAVACGGSSQEAAAPEPETSDPPAAAATPEPSEDLEGAEPERVVIRLNEKFDVVARNGTATDEAQSFIREHQDRLTRIYVDDYGELSPKTRVLLINLLVSFQTEATLPAHVAAISRYAEGKGDVDEAIWACQAAKRLKSPALADALMKAYLGIDMSDADGQRFGRHLADAMEFNAVPSWAPTLEKHRDLTVQSPDSFENKAAVRTYRNQQYWKETSARLLARLKSGAE